MRGKPCETDRIYIIYKELKYDRLHNDNYINIYKYIYIYIYKVVRERERERGKGGGREGVVRTWRLIADARARQARILETKYRGYSSIARVRARSVSVLYST